MEKEEYKKLSDFDKLRMSIKVSIKSHEAYKSEYWQGSKFMAENILKAIDSIERINKQIT